MQNYLVKSLTFSSLFLFWLTSPAQKGKDGAKTYSSGTSILNRYAIPASSISSGSTNITVTNIVDLNGSTSFTNAVNPYTASALAFGDIIMLIQLQGADMNVSDNTLYGSITVLNNAGNYELLQVSSVTGNQINLCSGVSKAYNQSGRNRTQVIRVPRLTTLTITAAAIVAGKPWDGTTGGIIAIETNGNILIDGTISSDTIGFRGGTDVNVTSAPSTTSMVSFYRRIATDSSAGKGESIVGNASDYGSLNGANGRGAPANGGGGGNGHNAGGGGGSNAGRNNSLIPYNGTGIKDTTGNWDNAWNLESAGFALDSSVGGGRGGYTYASNNRDALTEGPGLAVWGGDGRDNVGGQGGHPLNYTGGNTLFMGGGGGAGDGNNNAWGDGGRGAGIIFLLTNGNITGTGSIKANAQNGFNSRPAHNDAPGGAGGGGAIKILAQGSISGITINANGGNGGNQLITGAESEGPGGGGGGGYIESVTTGAIKKVKGGLNGTTSSSSVTEYIPNGATQGSPGTYASIIFTDIAAGCSLLPATLLDFSAVKNNGTVSLRWQTSSEINFSGFFIERSADGRNWNSLLFMPAKNNAGVADYTNDDKTPGNNKNFYRLRMVDKDGKYTYSKVVIIDFMMDMAVRIYPNPIKDNTIHVESIDIIQGLQIFNSTGQEVINRKGESNSIVIALPDMAAGVYQIKVISRRQTIIKQLIKIN